MDPRYTKDSSGNPLRVFREFSLSEPEIRTCEEIKGVLADPGCTCTGSIYFMFRDVAKNPEDRRWMQSQDLRYDITLIPPRTVCGEFVKTKGHYHPDTPGGVGYPEIYEVIGGVAHYLIQTRDLSDVILVKAPAGSVVLVPPGYGHVTINPSSTEILQMANIVSSRFSSDYSGYVERRGASWYEFSDGTFAKNPNCPEAPQLRFIDAKTQEKTGLLPGPLYNHITKRSPVLSCLNEPEKYSSLFRNAYS